MRIVAPRTGLPREETPGRSGERTPVPGASGKRRKRPAAVPRRPGFSCAHRSGRLFANMPAIDFGKHIRYRVRLVDAGRRGGSVKRVIATLMLLSLAAALSGFAVSRLSGSAATAASAAAGTAAAATRAAASATSTATTAAAAARRRRHRMRRRRYGIAGSVRLHAPAVWRSDQRRGDRRLPRSPLPTRLSLGSSRTCCATRRPRTSCTWMRRESKPQRPLPERCSTSWQMS